VIPISKLSAIPSQIGTSFASGVGRVNDASASLFKE
jgi:hypothetical protein